MADKAFFFRQKFGGKDFSEIAFLGRKVFIGWSWAPELLEVRKDYYQAREFVKKVYYPEDSTYRRAGNAMGALWYFLNEDVMPVDSLVMIPCAGGVYVGEIVSPCKFNPDWREEHRSFYRDVRWLVDRPIPRNAFRTGDRKALKTQGSFCSLCDYVDEILKVVSLHNQGKKPTLKEDVGNAFNQMLLRQLYHGRIFDYEFERLVEKMLVRKGYDTKIVARSQDTGTDIECTLSLFSGIEIPVFVQVKQWDPGATVGVDVFKKLLESMKEKKADYGLVVTTAKIDQQSRDFIEERNEDSDPYQLSYIDGEMLCAELVETGIFPEFDF